MTQPTSNTLSRSSEAPTRTGGVAARLESALRPFVGGDLPVRLRAWDGTEAGPVDAPLVELRSVYPEYAERTSMFFPQPPKRG